MNTPPLPARSWIDVGPESHFPIQNLPFCTFRAPGSGLATDGIRIGGFIVDVWELIEAGLVASEDGYDHDLSFSLLDDGRATLEDVRNQTMRLLDADEPRLRDDADLRARALHPVEDVELCVPMEIGAFVDFYSGIHHASNVGRMFRPDQPPLLPNYRHLPVGYNGRASSVVVSGTDVHRPRGLYREGDRVVYGPTRELDFELEVGFFTGRLNAMGEPVPADEAERAILGLVLVNDWSARDVQRFEYQPLGPFLAKSFATGVSPYVVTLAALEPFRIPGPAQEPEPSPHLRTTRPGHYDLHLEVQLQTAAMTRPQTICRTNARHLYWSFAQQLAHQASNGTPVEAGDLYASGTISGPEPGTFGSMLELAWRGERPLTMEETGETRSWLEDGDTVILAGWAQGDGYRIGLGEVRATVLPPFSAADRAGSGLSA